MLRFEYLKNGEIVNVEWHKKIVGKKTINKEKGNATKVLIYEEKENCNDKYITTLSI